MELEVGNRIFHDVAGGAGGKTLHFHATQWGILRPQAPPWCSGV